MGYSALQMAQAAEPVLRGENIPPGLRSKFVYDKVFSGTGSPNIAAMSAANQTAWAFHRDRNEFERMMQAWLGYANQQRFMCNETYTAHCYGPWQMQRVVMARGMALQRGFGLVAEALLPHIRKLRCLQALSAAPVRVGDPYPGHPIMMCGARSWACDRNPGPTENTCA